MKTILYKSHNATDREFCTVANILGYTIMPFEGFTTFFVCPREERYANLEAIREIQSLARTRGVRVTHGGLAMIWDVADEEDIRMELREFVNQLPPQDDDWDGD